MKLSVQNCSVRQTTSGLGNEEFTISPLDGPSYYERETTPAGAHVYRRYSPNRDGSMVLFDCAPKTCDKIDACIAEFKTIRPLCAIPVPFSYALTSRHAKTVVRFDGSQHDGRCGALYFDDGTSISERGSVEMFSNAHGVWDYVDLPEDR